LIEGLSHITLIVRDLDRTEELLTAVFDARKVYDSGEETFSLSKERFFIIADGAQSVWIATMETMEGKALPARTYNHVAFKIADADYEKYLARIRKLGLDQ